MALRKPEREKKVVESRKVERNQVRAALQNFLGDVYNAAGRALNASEPDALPRSAFYDPLKKKLQPGERQSAHAGHLTEKRMAARSKRAQEQYLLTERGWKLVGEETENRDTRDTLDNRSDNEIRRRLNVCADCIQAQKAKNGRFNERGCRICASDGILGTMLLGDDWAIEAAKTISLESIQLRRR